MQSVSKSSSSLCHEIKWDDTVKNIWDESSPWDVSILSHRNPITSRIIYLLTSVIASCIALINFVPEGFRPNPEDRL